MNGTVWQKERPQHFSVSSEDDFFKITWSKPEKGFLAESSDDIISRFDLRSYFEMNQCLTMWNLYNNQRGHIRDVLFSRKPRTITSVDEIIDFNHLDNSLRASMESVLACWRSSIGDPETAFELEVVKRFKDIPEVELIYVDMYLENHRFQIFTSNNKYDDELMDKLLEIEFELKSLERDLPFRFEYIPRIYGNINEITRSGSKLIYKRGFNVFFGGPSLAGTKEREFSEAVA